MKITTLPHVIGQISFLGYFSKQHLQQIFISVKELSMLISRKGENIDNFWNEVDIVIFNTFVYKAYVQWTSIIYKSFEPKEKVWPIIAVSPVNMQIKFKICLILVRNYWLSSH